MFSLKNLAPSVYIRQRHINTVCGFMFDNDKTTKLSTWSGDGINRWIYFVCIPRSVHLKSQISTEDFYATATSEMDN